MVAFAESASRTLRRFAPCGFCPCLLGLGFPDASASGSCFRVPGLDAPVCRDEDTSDGSGGAPDGDCTDASTGAEGVLVPHGGHLFGPKVESLIPKGAQGTK